MQLTQLSLALLTALGIGITAQQAHASSHREAPFITEMPKVDGTDFYMFTSYEPGRSDYVTLIANYLPLQAAYGGPNYFTLDPQARYEINVDNDGDARRDISFNFRFSVQQLNQTLSVGGKDVATPLANFGPGVTGITAGLNVRETYGVKVVRKNRHGDTVAAITNAVDGSTTFIKPVDNIGVKTIADYASYAADHVYTVNIPGCHKPAKVFVGQRREPFAVNLGEIFDLINLNPLGAPDGETNIIADENITSLELEIHKSCLTDGSDPVIGAWTTASLRQKRSLKSQPSYAHPARESGDWMQVSRLGMPLVNEVVIGLRDKDKFNASKPHNDAQFADYVTNPTLPALIETLFPIAPAPTNFPRLDLVTAFLTGIPGINQPMNVSAAEMLRLNTHTAPTAQNAQANLGVIGGDSAGFPNGRRPGDDVVDIELRVAMGVLCTLNDPATFGCVPGDAAAGGAPLTDGATVDAMDFDNTFPYLTTPVAGSPAN
jgi:hypothetical protein